jgi:hypothetical protein
MTLSPDLLEECPHGKTSIHGGPFGACNDDRKRATGSPECAASRTARADNDDPAGQQRNGHPLVQAECL